MGHEFVRGFYVETPAWHQLGVVLDGVPTMEKAVELTASHLKVVKHPMYYRMPDGTYRPAGESEQAIERYATVREDGTYLGDVGARYEVLQDAEAFQFFQPLIDQGKIALDAGVVLRGGRTLSITARILGDSGVADVLPSDPMYRYLVFVNSHDGWSAVTVSQTDVRAVCANMTRRVILQSMSGDGSSLRFKHTKTVRAGLDAAQKVIDLAAGTWSQDVEVYRAMARRPMSGAQFRAFALASMGKPHDSPIEEMHGKTRNILDALEQNFAAFDGPEVGSSTVWAAYNAVTRYVDHQRFDDQRRLFEQSWGTDVPMRDRAFEAATALLAS